MLAGIINGSADFLFHGLKIDASQLVFRYCYTHFVYQCSQTIYVWLCPRLPVCSAFYAHIICGKPVSLFFMLLVICAFLSPSQLHYFSSTILASVLIFPVLLSHLPCRRSLRTRSATSGESNFNLEAGPVYMRIWVVRSTSSRGVSLAAVNLGFAGRTLGVTAFLAV